MPPTRRNLFQSHLSRRPASGAPSSVSTSTSTSSSNSNNNSNALPLPSAAAAAAAADSHFNNSLPDALPSLSSQHISSSLASSTTTALIDNGEIIARDKNGKFQLDIPVLPPIPLDEEDDEDDEDEEDLEDGAGGAMEGIEEDGHGNGRPSAGSGGSGSSHNAAMSSELVGRDKEKLEAGLVETIYRNRNRDPEILNLIQKSLRSRVASLDDDNWMFEVEDDPHV